VTGYLLDTNALLFLAFKDTALSAAVKEKLVEAPRFVSVISAAEIAIKASVGKLALPEPFAVDFTLAFQTMVDREQASVLPLELSCISRLNRLPLHHRDPFDRGIIAQALDLDLTVATRDRSFRLYEGLDILEV
jgi:PIN domain nuclease of toxin-antitoxin system